MTECRTIHLLPYSLKSREVREGGAVVRYLDRELARLPIAAGPVKTACAYAMARLAENPDHPELHEEALAELRNILGTLWMSDDEMIEQAIEDLRSLIAGGDRFTALRDLGCDDELLTRLRFEAWKMLEVLLDDDEVLT